MPRKFCASKLLDYLTGLEKGIFDPDCEGVEFDEAMEYGLDEGEQAKLQIVGEIKEWIEEHR